MPQFLVVRTCFSYADLTVTVFQDPAMKLINQGHAKLKGLDDQHDLNILVPSSQLQD